MTIEDRVCRLAPDAYMRLKAPLFGRHKRYVVYRDYHGEVLGEGDTKGEAWEMAEKYVRF